MDEMDPETLDLIAMQVAVDTLVRILGRRWWIFSKEDRHWIRVQVNILHHGVAKFMYREKVKRGIPVRPLPDKWINPL